MQKIMCRKIKITVLKCSYDKEIAEQYANLDNPNLKQCPQHKEGDVYYTYWNKPDGLCNEAWKAMQHYVFALTHPDMAIITCPDGFKTVTFKIEAVDD